ncbi:MAG: hypothetical protein AVDCRST_MAG89-4844, partial [uncultured Gemmatimonadetes bacterium]
EPRRAEPGAARAGDRPAARVAQRQGAASDAGHHAAEHHAGGAERQQLRRVRRGTIPR